MPFVPPWVIKALVLGWPSKRRNYGQILNISLRKKVRGRGKRHRKGKILYTTLSYPWNGTEFLQWLWPQSTASPQGLSEGHIEYVKLGKQKDFVQWTKKSGTSSMCKFRRECSPKKTVQPLLQMGWLQAVGVKWLFWWSKTEGRQYFIMFRNISCCGVFEGSMVN